MRSDRAVLKLLLLVVALGNCDSATWAANGSGTLLQWGSGPRVQGGPNLDEPIVTDRPDFTEASVTVGMGVVQLEAGYTYTYDDNQDGKTEEHSYPETLFRIGMLAEWFELRLGWNYGDSAETVFGPGDGDDLSGAEDLYVGAKFALTPQSGCLPETGLILQGTVPTGAEAFTTHEVMPGVNFLYGWDVNDFFSVGGSTQANRAIEETDDYYVEFAQSITTGYGWTDEFASYAEWFMFAPAGAETAENQQYFNSGVTYLITDNVQWDLRAGVGLNEAADDFFAGSGISIRMF